MCGSNCSVGCHERRESGAKCGDCGCVSETRAEKIPQIKEVRGQGLMIGMEFEEPVKDIRRKLLFEERYLRGVSGTNVIRLLPPLCLTLAEADLFLTRFKKVLNNN